MEAPLWKTGQHAARAQTALQQIKINHNILRTTIHMMLSQDIVVAVLLHTYVLPVTLISFLHT